MSGNKTKIVSFNNKLFRVTTIVILIILAVIVVASLGIFAASDESESNLAVFEAKEGPLTISVTESGTIKALEQIIIKCEVEGKTSILFLEQEGKRVKKGDLLVTLDASELDDAKIDQEIKVQNANAAFIGARENLAVVENQAQSEIEKAQLTLDFAELDQRKYLDPNGDYHSEWETAKAQIELTQEELTRAQEKLRWSKKLYDEKYISEMEWKADELAASKKNTDLYLARNKLQLLETFTHERQVKQLESNVKQAQMALERTNSKASADVAQAEATLIAKESEYKREQDKLKKNEEQKEKTEIYSPADGLVIYATSAQRGGFRSSREPMDIGQEVQERQELIYLPTAASAKAEVNIHETHLKKVRLGLPAKVTVDAIPGKVFFGTVASIAPLPDAQSMWMNPDLKVYNAEVYLAGSDENLRTGMSCKVEIIIEQYENALYVPVQTVLRVGGEPTAFVAKGKNYEARKVEIGMDNNTMVRIISGLKVGDPVLLTPPLKSAALEEDSESMDGDEGSGLVNRKIDERLRNVNESGYEEQIAPGNDIERPQNGRVGLDEMPGIEGGGGSRGEQGQRNGRYENMSDQEREKMRERLRNMSPEEREKMRERFRNMSDEEKEKMRQQPTESR